MRDAISKLIASGQSEADFKGIPYTLAQMYALDCGAELAYMTKNTVHISSFCKASYPEMIFSF